MADHPDVVDRADALMRRRRSFVAGAASQAEQVLPLTAENDDVDLPVLTEIVSADAVVSEKRPDHLDETQVAMLASEIAHAIGQQLTYELPTLLEATLLTASAELRAGITETMNAALRDFIARRKQLRLPLDEPNRND